VSAGESNDLIGDSVDSSIDDPVIRGGTIDFSVDDGFAAAARAGGVRRIDGGTMILAGVVLASVAGLWSMRFLGTIAGQSTMLPAAEQAQVGTWVTEAEKQGAVVGLDDLRVLDELDKDRLNDLQVAITDLRSLSPFTYYGEFATKEVAKAPAAPVNTVDQLKDEFDAVIDQIGSRMKVTAILAPDTPRAQTVLNGYRLMVGDVFDVPHEGREFTFEVVRIGRDGVVFLSRLAEPAHERRIEVPVHRDY
jgi:hypothetical protein